MKSLKPNGDFVVREELQTTAVFPKAYTIEQAMDELRASKACGKFIVHLANGGIQKLEMIERQLVEVT